MLALRQQNIASVLGIGKPKSAMGYVAAIERGLPIQSLERVTRQIAPDDKEFKYRLIAKATLARRQKAKRLSPEESNRLSRLAQVWSCALDVWQNSEDARAFLNRPHALLEGRTPMEAALKTEVGARMVEEILGRLEHGTAA
ncbi:MAG: DUF2384 domain-containing protein [Alphaproteobacteria bacterium]|jgi:putative toxin-antitoxin system antitoxin component (TIGR02293 family)|nr:DUF2384 domain-containing protein [Alphaproteobacteria bacterium]|tara:strand:- start:103 stop:528 length:426 start_codon:yes stop_codon:yes gene_type:complete